MGRQPARLAILELALRPESGVPRYRQLYEAIREAIVGGRIAPGRRLPSTRTLAADVRCSRNTVVAAFDQLAAEGYLESRIGAGTTVADTVPDAALKAPPSRKDRMITGQRRRLSRRATVLAHGPAHRPAVSPSRPFRLGVCDIDVASGNAWARLAARCARGMPRRLFEYGDPAGFRPLREAIATYLREARGIRCGVEQVIIVSGSQQGIDLTARVLLDPGDAVWVEDPCYPGARGAFAAAGAHLWPVPVDSEGLRVNAAAPRAPRPRLVYVTPSHQFPLGVTMSLSRRLALLELARRTGAWILEDDHNSLYRYASGPPAALHDLDRSGCVIHLGTFSKALFPSLRIGYLVVPPELVRAFLAVRGVADRHSPAVTQAVLAEFIDQGHFARHVRRNRVRYARLQAVLVGTGRRLAGRLEVGASEAGMHLVGWLPCDTDDAAVARCAVAHGVDVTPLSAYRLRARGPGGLLLGYTGYGEREILDGVRRLETALRVCLGGARS